MGINSIRRSTCTNLGRILYLDVSLTNAVTLPIFCLSLISTWICHGPSAFEIAPVILSPSRTRHLKFKVQFTIICTTPQLHKTLDVPFSTHQEMTPISKKIKVHQYTNVHFACTFLIKLG